MCTNRDIAKTKVDELIEEIRNLSYAINILIMELKEKK